ncbi:MAG: hypothetical protein ACKOI2_03645 [Actinomycetota bacterium]
MTSVRSTAVAGQHAQVGGPTHRSPASDGLVSLPAALVAEERLRIEHRLKALEVADPVLRERALAELRHRLAAWWAVPSPPSLGQSDLAKVAWGSTTLPIVVERDSVEELILSAIASTEPTVIGIADDGAVYHVDAQNNYRIFSGELSPLLERVVLLFMLVSGGKTREFFYEDGVFFADYAGIGEFRPFAVIGSERVSTIADRCLDALGDPMFRLDPVNGLVVNYRSGEWPDKGVLSEVGYHVGISGLETEARRQILRKVVNLVLIGIAPSSGGEIREWGDPRSEQRIVKIANCLAGFTSQARRRRRADMSRAIADWESDLHWLRQTYGR